MQKFSIAISVYKNDNPIFFDRALESITDLQTIKPDEICLVVDGPIPNEIDEVIVKYDKKYTLKIIRLEKNGGLGNALKIATENATYDLIARMDSDDVSVPTRFEEQLKFFEEHPEIDIVGGNITEFINEETNIVAKRCVPTTNEDIRGYMKKRCAFNHVSVMFKKRAILDVGGYLDWHYNEDYFLWIRMWLNNAIMANTGSVLVNVRTGTDMYSRRGGRKYYESEKSLQQYMYQHKMINWHTYILNVAKRFIMQCLLPNSIRGWVFRHLAREKI